MSIEKLKREYEITTHYTAYPLRPGLPDKGLEIKKMYEDRGLDTVKMMNVLKKSADRAGLPLGEPDRSYNSRMAQELWKWAESLGKGDEFHLAVFNAFFAEGKNISSVTVLSDIAESVDLSAEEARDMFHSRKFSSMVDYDWKRSKDFDIQVIPTYIAGESRLAGSQKFQVLKRLVETGHANSGNGIMDSL